MVRVRGHSRRTKGGFRALVRPHTRGEGKKVVRDNEWFVYEDGILRAAQRTKKGALRFMKPGFVLIHGEDTAIAYEENNPIGD